MKIYTKKGDQGKTSLVSGTLVSKNHVRIEAYGNVDELNSMLGFLHSIISDYQNLENWTHELLEIEKIQNQLFIAGSLLSCDKEEFSLKLPQLKNDFHQGLESSIDKWTSHLPELKNFILPGGTKASSVLHLCRTICRRTERNLVLLSDSNQWLAPNTLIYFNRFKQSSFYTPNY